jgi:tRNA uridine 5-carboxymethylaminomethyl modification enzyme
LKKNVHQHLFLNKENGDIINSKSVVITTGTFLRANINIGLETRPAGRLGDAASIELGNSLERIGFKMGRLKTGTPPRLDGRTIDFSRVEKKYPDYPPVPFSFMNERVLVDSDQQLLTHMTQTNEQVAKIIKDTLHLNRHVKEETRGPRFISIIILDDKYYNNATYHHTDQFYITIKSTIYLFFQVRYCPSLESKIIKFHKDLHQIWLEPEGFTSHVIYPQGMSCTLPGEYQQKMFNKIVGLENVKILEFGWFKS